jgi:hypothetical protein
MQVAGWLRGELKMFLSLAEERDQGEEPPEEGGGAGAEMVEAQSMVRSVIEVVHRVYLCLSLAPTLKFSKQKVST